MVSSLPDYPWQTVGTDLFELKQKQYLVVVDYYSRYPEIVKLSSTTSTSVIAALKVIFSRFGIPEIVRSDNGPQFSSKEFAVFAKSYNFTHTTSSPLYPQSNGQAERAVQTLKKILRQSEDVCQGLLNYRTTPMPWCNLSPAELLMGRKLRSLLPMTDQQLIPQWSYLPEFKRTDQLFKDNQKRNFDKRYRTSEWATLPNNSEVWVTSGREPVRGRVVAAADTPRSYLVNTPSGVIRRNQQHLRAVPESSDNTSPDPVEENRSEDALPDCDRPEVPAGTEDPPTIIRGSGSRVTTRSQTGTAIVPPKRYQT